MPHHLESAVLEPENVKPLCPVFGACGGCAYQDLSYERELELKEDHLRSVLQPALSLDESLFEPIEASPRDYGYRHRLDLTLKRTRDTGFLAGFQLPGSRKMVSIDACAIARGEVSGFIPELIRQAVEKLPEDYRVANLVVKTGDDGRVLWGGIGRRSLELLPADYLWTEIRGRRIFYSLDTFFQANLSILPALGDYLERTAEWTKETVLLDLYAGVGLFTLMMADRIRHAVAIEESPASIRLMKYNLAYHRLEHAVIHQGSVEAHIGNVLAAAGGSRITAVVDPPRRGLSETALEAIAGAHALKELFYLSCSPESLARDLKKFLSRGWRIERIKPFDFFPKTRHLETLVCLRPC